MNIAKADIGVGDDSEEIQGDPSAVLAEITLRKEPINMIEFQFEGGHLMITKDNDVLGEVEDIEHSAFVLKRIVVHAGKKRKNFADLNEAVEWARVEPGFEDFEFEILATTPQGDKRLKKKFKEILIDIDDAEFGKSDVREIEA